MVSPPMVKPPSAEILASGWPLARKVMTLPLLVTLPLSVETCVPGLQPATAATKASTSNGECMIFMCMAFMRVS